VRIVNVRSSLFALLFAVPVGFGVVACSSGDSGPTKRVASGIAAGIVSDGDQHVAYLTNAPSAFGSKGDLHVASADGNDVKVASGVSVGGYVISPNGKALMYALSNAAGDDASFNWVDLSQPSATPKVLFDRGLQTLPISPSAPTPTYTTPLASEGFFSPSGRYFVMGVLAPNVGVSPDLHVIDVNTGTDVFSRPNGAFDYLELVLPDDTLIFQDSVGGNSGPSGPPSVQTLFWVSLSTAGAQATAIDTRTGGLFVSGDNKTLVYQKVDDRTLHAWDVTTHPATGTQIATNALNFAVGESGPVAYVGTDKSVHVVGLDGKAVVDVPGATANADVMSPIVISSDGADVYYFQNVTPQDSRGTLMHLAVAGGGSPTKIADAASTLDVHPVMGGLVFMQNVDDMGQFGDAVRGGRDGSAPTPLGSKVPVGGLTLVTPKGGGTSFLMPVLTMASTDKSKKLVDGAPATVGGLALLGSGGAANLSVDPSVRVGQFEVADDLGSVAYAGGVAFDSTVNNYFGALYHVDAAAGMKSDALLQGVTEVGPVVGRSLFVNAPKASTPGVYFVKY
jgi:hypothetical protein